MDSKIPLKECLVEQNIINSQWTIENTKLLIELRITHDKLFEDFNSENEEGWTAILSDFLCINHITNFTIDAIKKRWNSVVQIYHYFHNFFTKQSNMWPYFDMIDTFYKFKMKNEKGEENLCRLCYKESGFYSLNSQKKFDKLIENYLKIKVSKDGKTYPKKICLDCKSKIEEIHSFKLRCQKVNKNLRLIMHHVKTSKKIIETYSKNQIQVEGEIPGIVLIPGTTEIIENVEIISNDSYEPEIKDIAEMELKKPYSNLETIKNSSRLNCKDKQFLCSTCGEEINNLRALQVHENRHQGNKHFSCKNCCAKFYTQNGLSNHYKKEHLKLRFTCKKCPKVLKNQSALKRHELTHTGEKNYKCDLCHLKYYTPNEVRSHVRRIHGGKKKLSCSICYKPYFTNSELKIHMRYHLGERPFKCEYPGCEKKYAEKTNLHYHIKIKHKNDGQTNDNLYL